MSFKLAEVLQQTPDALLARDVCPVGKVPYYTKADAQEAVRRINRKHAAAMRAFRCSYCDRYHLGHRR